MEKAIRFFFVVGLILLAITSFGIIAINYLTLPLAVLIVLTGSEFLSILSFAIEVVLVTIYIIKRLKK